VVGVRVETIGPHALYLGDCLEILPEIGDVDAIVTDPPFSFAGGISNGRGSIVDDQFFKHWWKDVCKNLTKISKPEIEGFIWCDWKTAQVIASGFLEDQVYGLRISQMLYHYREMPGMGRPFRSSVDMVAYLRGPKSSGKRIQNTTHNLISKYWYYGKHKNHPSEKDWEIACQLIKWCSDPNDIIIDPFMGSGTTGVACMKMGRKFIGIEIKEKHFDVAYNRMRSEYEKTGQ
jgi:DNA modification methylase